MPNQHDPLLETEGDDSIPVELARALDESEEDLRHGHLEDIDEFIVRMKSKLQNHLANKV